MTTPLRVLVVEDRASDAELMLHTLRQDGFEPDWQRVEAEPEYLAALETPPDLILADWSLPQFGGLRALQLMRARGQDIPFVIVSGSIGEEAAIEAVRQGASDYVLKDRLARLGQAVRHALEDKRLRVEREQADAALRASEANLREAQKLGRIGSWEYDLTSQKVTWSDQTYELYERDPHLGPPGVEEEAAYYTPDQARVLREYARRAVEEGASFEYDLEARFPSGKRATFAAKMRPVRDAGGRVVKFFGTVQDITGRKQMEEALQASENRLRTFLNSSSDLAFLKDAQLRYIYANQALVDFFGRPIEEVIGKTDFELMPAGAAEVGRLSDLAALEHKVIQLREEKVGGRFFDTIKFPVELGEGQEGVGGFMRDISERKQAEWAIDLMSEVHRRLVHLENVKDVYQLAGEKIQELIGDGLVVVSMLDELIKAMKPACMYGLGETYDSLVKSFNMDPIRITYPLQDMTADELRLFRSGRLIKFEGGLYRLMVGKAPRRVCRAVEKQLKIREIYTMGLVSKEQHLGGITILARQDITPYKEVIESITNQTAITLNRLLSEQALRQSEERYRLLFELSPDAIAVYQDGKLAFVNQAAARLVGAATPEEVIGRPMLDFIHPDYREMVLARSRQQMRDGRPAPTTVEKFIRMDGSSVDVDVTASPFSYHDKPAVMAIIRDITERKQADEARRESEERFRHLYENATIGLYRTSPDGEILLANPSLIHMLGYEFFEDLSRRNLEKNGFEPGYSRRGFRQLIETRDSVVGLEAPWKRKDGTTIFVRESAKAIRDEDGKVLYYEGTVEDITERKRAEEALRESQARLDLALQAAQMGVWSWDIHEDKRQFDDQACRLLGFDPETFSGAAEEFFRAVHPDDRETISAALARTIEQDVLYEPEYRAVWPDGSLHYLAARGRLVRDATGQPARVNGLFWDITGRRQAEDKLARQAEELARLYRASGSLISTGSIDLENVSQAIAEVMLNEFGQANCSVFIVQEQANELKRIAVAGPYADQVSKTILTLDGPGLVPQAIRSGEKINTPDVRTIPHYVPAWEAARAELTIPLKIGDRVIGAIDVQSAESGAFTPDDEHLMSVFAERAALSLEHARLYAQTQRRMQNLSALRTIDMAISSSLDIHLTLNILLDQVVKQLNIHAADVLIYNQETQVLLFAAGQGFRTQALQHTNLRMGDGYAGRVVRERQVVLIPDLSRNLGELVRSSELSREGFQTYVGVPLIAKGQVKGVLEIFQREPLELDAERRDFIDMLGGQAAIAIDNTELFENLQTSNAELFMAYDETIEGWSHAMDLRDEETEGHSKRVTELTLRLASNLGISPVDMVHVRRGALLHDIGKIGVPDSILRKPGALSEEEWLLMRKHPQLAYDMLAPITYLRKALEIPYCHHEKFDGTGYPRGLTGSEIPLSARIFAVVDVWDALISNRPYRKAWSQEKALNYIRAQAGKHFDPMVVRVFLKEVPNVK